jgi:hypothetical protein
MDATAFLWGQPVSPDLGEVLAFARRIVREVRHGVLYAARWLAALGYDIAIAFAVVRSA